MTSHQDMARDILVAIYQKNPHLMNDKETAQLQMVLDRVREHLSIPRRDRRSSIIRYTNEELQKLERQLEAKIRSRNSAEFGLPATPTPATFDDAIDRLEDVLEGIRNPAVRYGWQKAIEHLKEDRKDLS